MAMNRFLLLAALCFLVPALATAQEAERDPFAPTPEAPAPKEDGSPPVRVRLETWEAPALVVSRKLDEVLSAADLAALREQCLGGAEGVSLVLSSLVNTTTPSKVSAESITERIYPTEYEPPELTCGQAAESVKPPANLSEIVKEALVGTTPTSFETRNTGTTIELEAMRFPHAEKTWDVRIAVDDVHLVGRDHFGGEALKIEMPAFTSFRTTGEVRLKEGEWQILSVLEPPRGMEGKPSDKRWITLVRLDVVK